LSIVTPPLHQAIVNAKLLTTCCCCCCCLVPFAPSALRQAIAKAIIAYYQKYVDEQSKVQIKETLLQYDRTLLVADPRRCEPKK
jgi:hypothetical protein